MQTIKRSAQRFMLNLQDTFVPIIGVVFLSTDDFKKYRDDLVFDKFQTRITASRMYIELSARGVSERFTFLYFAAHIVTFPLQISDSAISQKLESNQCCIC